MKGVGILECSLGQWGICNIKVTATAARFDLGISLLALDSGDLIGLDSWIIILDLLSIRHTSPPTVETASGDEAALQAYPYDHRPKPLWSYA